MPIFPKTTFAIPSLRYLALITESVRLISSSVWITGNRHLEILTVVTKTTVKWTTDPEQDFDICNVLWDWCVCSHFPTMITIKIWLQYMYIRLLQTSVLHIGSRPNTHPLHTWTCCRYNFYSQYTTISSQYYTSCVVRYITTDDIFQNPRNNNGQVFNQ